jgi:hypothetical protein
VRNLKPNKKKADELFRSLINLKYDKCQNCGSGNNKQCAHLASRGYYSTRWSVENAVILCKGCHMYYTHHPLEWDDWCYKRLGTDWDDLKFRAKNFLGKTDYKKLTEQLKEEINVQMGK